MANSLGAALALLPRTRVLEAVEAGEVPADVAENLHEVFNVGANLLNAPDQPHLKLAEVLVGADVGDELVHALTWAAERVDLAIDVPGFGAGPFAVVSAGPDTPTRDPDAAPAPVAEAAPPAEVAPVAPDALARTVVPGGPLDAFDFEAPLPCPPRRPAWSPASRTCRRGSASPCRSPADGSSSSTAPAPSACRRATSRSPASAGPGSTAGRWAGPCSSSPPRSPCCSPTPSWAAAARP